MTSTLLTLKDRFRNCLSAKNYVKVCRCKQRLWIQHTNAVSGLAVDANRGELYSISWDKSFKTWNTSFDAVNYVAVSDGQNKHDSNLNALAVTLDEAGLVYSLATKMG
ncbi:protein JINGUBANG-like [Salvia divinorum]|uniref:Protein JINGUBANG-like n=1 Tax=Salvia divinorum TaxID=28513 RepID=A0ABD1GFV7_SALDI